MATITVSELRFKSRYMKIWFSPESMDFSNTKLETEITLANDGYWYFLTSENMGDGIFYTMRRIRPGFTHIDTLTEHGEILELHVGLAEFNKLIDTTYVINTTYIEVFKYDGMSPKEAYGVVLEDIKKGVRPYHATKPIFVDTKTTELYTLSDTDGKDFLTFHTDHHGAHNFRVDFSKMYIHESV